MGFLKRKKNEIGNDGFDKLTLTLVTIGGINWLPVAFGSMDWVTRILGENVFSTIIIGAVGFSGVYLAGTYLLNMVMGNKG